MKLYYAKVAVFVDDELNDREVFELIPLLSKQVHVDSMYLEKEFGVAVRCLWTSLEDATETLTPEQMAAIEKLFKKKGK